MALTFGAHSNLFQHADGGVGLIEDIEMDAWHPGLSQILTLANGVFDANFRGGFGVGLILFQTFCQGGGDGRFAQS